MNGGSSSQSQPLATPSAGDRAGHGSWAVCLTTASTPGGQFFYCGLHWSIAEASEESTSFPAQSTWRSTTSSEWQTPGRQRC